MSQRQPTQNLNFSLPKSVSKTAEDFLKAISENLQISDTKYDEAERKYTAVGNWLKRPESHVRGYNPDVYSQGSFALGTVIKPVSEAEEYDIDMICALNIDQTQTTQHKVKEALKHELSLYAKKYSMADIEDHRRCVRLIYGDKERFHLDATPAVPDRNRQRLLLEKSGITNEWAAFSVSITDNEHPSYKTLTTDWPHSNPRGYAKWFRARMKTIFEQRREAMRLNEKRARIEDIPEYRVRTPLQLSIQILKRHRDMTHEGEACDKPISIIITTLATLAYNQETTIRETLYNVLSKMAQFIKVKNGVTWIENPTDPLENFADKWQKFPEREEAFYSWLRKAHADFSAIAGLQEIKEIGELMAPALGPRLVESAVNKSYKQSSGSLISNTWKIFSPSHKQPPPWRITDQGTVSIREAKYLQRGFRWIQFESGGQALPKGCELQFSAITNVPEPYNAYWQVVNTGAEATMAAGLRGNFIEMKFGQGQLQRKERTHYRGSHTIECFIVKNDLCVARSGPFIVNIQ